MDGTSADAGICRDCLLGVPLWVVCTGNGNADTGHRHGTSQRNSRNLQSEDRQVRLRQRRSSQFGSSNWNVLTMMKLPISVCDEKPETYSLVYFYRTNG